MKNNVYLTKMKKKTKYILHIVAGLILMTLQILLSYFDRFVVALLPHLAIERLESRVMTAKELTPKIIRVTVVSLFYLIYSLI